MYVKSNTLSAPGTAQQETNFQDELVERFGLDDQSLRETIGALARVVRYPEYLLYRWTPYTGALGILLVIAVAQELRRRLRQGQEADGDGERIPVARLAAQLGVSTDTLERTLHRDMPGALISYQCGGPTSAERGHRGYRAGMWRVHLNALTPPDQNALRRALLAHGAAGDLVAAIRAVEEIPPMALFPVWWRNGPEAWKKWPRPENAGIPFVTPTEADRMRASRPVTVLDVVREAAGERPLRAEEVAEVELLEAHLLGGGERRFGLASWNLLYFWGRYLGPEKTLLAMLMRRLEDSGRGVQADGGVLIPGGAREIAAWLGLTREQSVTDWFAALPSRRRGEPSFDQQLLQRFITRDKPAGSGREPRMVLYILPEPLPPLEDAAWRLACRWQAKLGTERLQDTLRELASRHALESVAAAIAGEQPGPASWPEEDRTLTADLAAETSWLDANLPALAADIARWQPELLAGKNDNFAASKPGEDDDLAASNKSNNFAACKSPKSNNFAACKSPKSNNFAACKSPKSNNFAALFKDIRSKVILTILERLSQPPRGPNAPAPAGSVGWSDPPPKTKMLSAPTEEPRLITEQPAPEGAQAAQNQPESEQPPLEQLLTDINSYQPGGINTQDDQHGQDEFAGGDDQDQREDQGDPDEFGDSDDPVRNEMHWALDKLLGSASAKARKKIAERAISAERMAALIIQAHADPEAKDPYALALWMAESGVAPAADYALVADAEPGDVLLLCEARGWNADARYAPENRWLFGLAQLVPGWNGVATQISEQRARALYKILAGGVENGRKKKAPSPGGGMDPEGMARRAQKASATARRYIEGKYAAYIRH